jgi:sugar phosphate isomerase/epimerase
MNPTFSIFPKFFQDLSVPELAQFVRDVGLDTTNAIIRPGYWADPENLGPTLSAFVSSMRDEGLEVTFVTTGWSPADIIADEEVLGTCAECGIRDVRVTQIHSGGKYGGVGDVRAELDEARRTLAQLAQLSEKHGVRSIYQVHHMTLLTTPSALYPLVKDLPPQYLGAMIDPGNQLIEGYENWRRSARLLGDHLVALGVKDTAWVQEPGKLTEDAKGWSSSFVPCQEGMANWKDVGRALCDVDFTGTLVFMPFYKRDTPSALRAAIRDEVAYIRQSFAAAEEDADE